MSEPDSTPVPGARPVPQREPGAVTLPHMPALDGIRGIAVLLVVGVHLWIYLGARRGAPDQLEWFAGGLLGVNIFFVLSGALITSLLLAEHRSTGGICLKRFYERRVRRLGPALLVALLLVGLSWTVVERSLGDRPGLAVLSVVFFFSNWVRVVDLNSLGMLAPAWSLAVEEQFYLTWPLLLGFLLRRKSRPYAVIVGLLLTVLLCQAYVLIVVEHVDDVRTVYYQPFIGAMGLLLGCALAVYVAHHRTGFVIDLLGNVWIAVAACLAVYGLVSMADGPEEWLFRGGFLAVMALTTVVVGHVMIRALQPSAVTRVLSVKPLTWVGLVSYGMYLFHVPVIIIVGRRQEASPVRQMVIALIVTALLSAASYYYFEKPIRQRRGGGVRARPTQEPLQSG